MTSRQQHIDYFSTLNSRYKHDVWKSVWELVRIKLNEKKPIFDDPLIFIFDETSKNMENLDFHEKVLSEIKELEEMFQKKLPYSYIDFLLADGVSFLHNLSEYIFQLPNSYNILSKDAFYLSNVPLDTQYFFLDYNTDLNFPDLYLTLEESEDIDLNYYNDFSDYYVGQVFFPIWLKSTLKKSIVIGKDEVGNGSLIWMSPDCVTKDGEWETTIFYPTGETVRYASFGGSIIYLLRELYAFFINYESPKEIKSFENELFNLVFPR